MIPANIYIQDSNKTMSNELREWSKDNTRKKKCGNIYNSEPCTYEEFINGYIKDKEEVKKMYKKEEELNELNINIKKLQDESEGLNDKNIKQLLDDMSEKKKNDFFENIKNIKEKENNPKDSENKDEEIINDHYFSLIKYLIKEELIDKNYANYRSCFSGLDLT